MFTVKKRLEISAAHKLNLSYDSPCKNMHGHNWIIDVYCRSTTLNENGMVVDFALIKGLITNAIDHKDLNKALWFNPTAENIAKYICELIPHCYKVMVKESKNNIAWYERY